MTYSDKIKQIQYGDGFIAALDQSGGSTPKALGLYGINEDSYSNDEEMYDLIHAMRSRIANAPAFTGEKIIGAILFEMTMNREIGGKPSAKFMWENRGVVPFLKIDQGLETDTNGVQLMKPMPNLNSLLQRAVDCDIFGTKMRSVINSASPHGISDIIAQQFDIGCQILSHKLIPIIEPEVTINISDKHKAEEILRDEIEQQLNNLPEDQQVMLKLTLPEKDNLYLPLVKHPRVMRVVALSGGYDRATANKKLAQNTGIIASFSRALTEGLSAQQSDEDFNACIAQAINDIARASAQGNQAAP